MGISEFQRLRWAGRLTLVVAASGLVGCTPPSGRPAAARPTAYPTTTLDRPGRQEALRVREEARRVREAARLAGAEGQARESLLEGDRHHEAGQVALYNGDTDTARSDFRRALDSYRAAAERVGAALPPPVERAETAAIPEAPAEPAAAPEEAAPEVTERADEQPEPASAPPEEEPDLQPALETPPARLEEVTRAEVDARWDTALAAQNRAYLAGALRLAPEPTQQADQLIFDAQIATEHEDLGTAATLLDRITALYEEAYQAAVAQAEPPAPEEPTPPAEPIAAPADTTPPARPEAGAGPGASIDWANSYLEGVTTAERQRKPIFLLLYEQADEELAAAVSDPSITTTAARYICVKQPVKAALAGPDSLLSASERAVSALMERLVIRRFPVAVLLGPDLELIGVSTSVRDAASLQRTLDDGLRPR